MSALLDRLSCTTAEEFMDLLDVAVLDKVVKGVTETT